MSLTDTTYIREYHSFSNDEPSDSFLEIQIRRARKKLTKLVGEAAYSDAALPVPTDESRTEDLKDAEAELVMYYGVAKLNLKVSNLGIVQSSKSESIGDGSFQIATPEQIKKFRDDYYKNALDFIDEYLEKSPGVVAVKA